MAGFIGRNGAGKTTTIKAMLNMIHPDGGTVRYFGKPFVGNEAEIKKRIGYSAGTVSWYPRKKIRDIVDIIKRFYDIWDEEAYRYYLPGYPILCSAFFVTLGIFQSFQTAREANDMAFSALLPIAKRDIVKGKYLFNWIFVGGFFKTAYKFARPFVSFIVACFLCIFIAESLHHVPRLETLNAFGADEMALQLILLVAGICIFLLMTGLSYRRACDQFERIDL